MFKEGNERSCYRGDLCGRHVHKLDLRRRNDGEVGVAASLDSGADKCSVGIEGSIALGNHLALFQLGGEVHNVVVVEVHLRVLYLAVGSFDKAEVVDLGIHAERADKTDVRAFRRFDRTKTSVVGVVHVAHLEAGTLTRKTAGAESRQTALVGQLGQGVGLVHELAQRVGAEEGVDNARDCLGVDKVGGCEHLVVANVHTLADSAAHTGQTDTELVVELLAHGTHAAVRQVVDIVDVGAGVDELYEVADNGYDILLGENLHVHARGQAELAVYAVTAHVAEVVALLREEQVEDYFTGAGIIRRLGVAELSVDILDSLLLGVRLVLLEGVEYD